MLKTYTLFHVILSLVGIATGLVVLAAMIGGPAGFEVDGDLSLEYDRDQRYRFLLSV